MLIKEKLPGVYPQITHAPTNYVDFLNFFRGGHTIDDNLDVTKIAETMQAGMLRAAIASGHLTKAKNMAIPSDYLVDITLTKSAQGEAQVLPKICQQRRQSSRSRRKRRWGRHDHRATMVSRFQVRQIATIKFNEGGLIGFPRLCAFREQPFVAVIEMLCQFLNDLGFPGWVQPQWLQSFPDLRFPIRHAQSP